MITESVQIRRARHANDFWPAYTTAELLRGVCHIVQIEIKKDTPSPKLEGGLTRERFATIKAMLQRNATNEKIGIAICMSKESVSRLIRTSDELKELSHQRIYATYEAKKDATAKRFEANEAAIREAATTLPLYKVAAKFGFAEATLKKLMEGA